MDHDEEVAAATAELTTANGKGRGRRCFAQRTGAVV